jgi:U3 small nucleolar RNA-associated protein 22
MPKAVSSTKKIERKAAPKVSKAKAPSPALKTDDESIGDEELEDSMIDIQLEDEDDDDASMGDESIGDDEDGMMDEDDVEDVEDENQEGVDKDEGPQAGPSKPQPKGNHRNLYAPPTLDELDNLSSTSSASFTLQLSALLQSTLLPTTPHSSLKTLLTELHSTINTIPASAALTPREGIEKVGLPIISPSEFMPRKVNWTVGYSQPKEVFVSGSWSVVGGYKTGKGEQGGVDMVLVMPDVRFPSCSTVVVKLTAQELFTPKDRLDYRYFYKRGYYLGIVKSSLEKASRREGGLGGATVAWDSQDERRPVIAISVGKGVSLPCQTVEMTDITDQGLKHRLTVRIHASPPPHMFAPTSLSPSRSLLRHADLDQSSPTPHYSNSLLHDTLHKSNLLHLHRLSTSLNERVVDSFMALWRIWCTRRGIRRERGGSGWFGQMVLGWVINGGEIGSKGLKRRGLGKGLGYWGALRAGWEFLGASGVF